MHLLLRKPPQVPGNFVPEKNKVVLTGSWFAFRFALQFISEKNAIKWVLSKFHVAFHQAVFMWNIFTWWKMIRIASNSSVRKKFRRETMSPHYHCQKEIDIQPHFQIWVTHNRLPPVWVSSERHKKTSKGCSRACVLREILQGAQGRSSVQVLDPFKPKSQHCVGQTTLLLFCVFAIKLANISPSFDSASSQSSPAGSIGLRAQGLSCSRFY